HYDETQAQAVDRGIQDLRQRANRERERQEEAAITANTHSVDAVLKRVMSLIARGGEREVPATPPLKREREREAGAVDGTPTKEEERQERERRILKEAEDHVRTAYNNAAPRADTVLHQYTPRDATVHRIGSDEFAKRQQWLETHLMHMQDGTLQRIQHFQSVLYDVGSTLLLFTPQAVLGNAPALTDAVSVALFELSTPAHTLVTKLTPILCGMKESDAFSTFKSSVALLNTMDRIMEDVVRETIHGIFGEEIQESVDSK
ncbi:hypothetical protein KIPB_011862, partial [Kipferlia bialata]